MEDGKIVYLYWERSERAIPETAKKYGRYCFSIAYRILSCKEDAEESVNDTYVGAWNGMPPHRPSVLSVFLGKITRRISVDKFRKKTARKRGGGEMPLILDELFECVADDRTVDGEMERKRLAETVNSFVLALPETERQVFLRRYWYMDAVADIGRRFGFSESKVKSMLARTREKLRAVLIREDFYDAL